MTLPKFDVGALIDRLPIRGALLWVPVLCSFSLLVEGMDTYGVGYIGPHLAKEFGVSQSLLGLIYAGTVVASLIGAVVLAPLSDRYGRRLVLILANALVAVCTLLMPLADSGVMLFVVRFVIGLCFGAAVPVAFALTADFAPSRHRAKILMMMSSGIALGMALSGLMAGLVVPGMGWRVFVMICACASVISTTLLALKLPESLAFLLRRRPAEQCTHDALRGLGASFEEARRSQEAPQPTPTSARANAKRLLAPGIFATSLTLLWVMALTYAVEFFLSYWMPTLLMQAGGSVMTAGFVGAVAKCGSIAGAIGVGYAMDRAGQRVVLRVSYGCAALLLLILGAAQHMPGLMAVSLIVVAYFFIDGSFSGIQAATASAYPSDLRATATGWVIGLSRLIGGSTGAAVGGYVADHHISGPIIAIGLAVLMGLGALSVKVSRRERQAVQLHQA